MPNDSDNSPDSSSNTDTDSSLPPDVQDALETYRDAKPESVDDAAADTDSDAVSSADPDNSEVDTDFSDVTLGRDPTTGPDDGSESRESTDSVATGEPNDESDTDTVFSDPEAAQTWGGEATGELHDAADVDSSDDEFSLDAVFGELDETEESDETGSPVDADTADGEDATEVDTDFSDVDLGRDIDDPGLSFDDGDGGLDESSPGSNEEDSDVLSAASDGSSSFDADFSDVDLGRDTDPSLDDEFDAEQPDENGERGGAVVAVETPDGEGKASTGRVEEGTSSSDSSPVASSTQRIEEIAPPDTALEQRVRTPGELVVDPFIRSLYGIKSLGQVALGLGALLLHWGSILLEWSASFLLIAYGFVVGLTVIFPPSALGFTAEFAATRLGLIWHMSVMVLPFVIGVFTVSMYIDRWVNDGERYESEPQFEPV